MLYDRIKSPIAGRCMQVLILGFVVLYGLGFFCLWLSDPLAQSPVLDARENLFWAQAIQMGTVPAEPFYRALLYPWLLAKIGFSVGLSGGLAAGLGLLCHFLNAALVGAIAQRLWQRRAASVLAGGVYACYPVSLWFAVQVLDITLAITLFLLALYALLRVAGERAVGWMLLAGAAAGLAVVTRPNFLPPVLFFPLLAGALVFIARRKYVAAVLAVLWVGVPLLGILLAQGGLNYQRSGEFRVLPWQGAYNLHAANRAGANGKFYMQRVSFDVVREGQNTTRMESEYLYQQAHPNVRGTDIAEMNAYWRAQLVEEVTADPVRWMGLMGRKLVYLVNDWEQYNNLTYAFHKQRLAALHWNPLGWGLLVLGACVALILGRRSFRWSPLSVLLLVSAAYAAGVLLFFVSARFRLPLAPLLCVFAGGLAVLPWREIPLGKYFAVLVSLGMGSVVIYGDWFDASDTPSYVQDEMLLANAAHRLSRDEMALTYAEAALSRDSSLTSARQVQIASLFYLWTEAEQVERTAYWERLGTAVSEGLETEDRLFTFIRGLYCWREGDRDQAELYWALGAAGGDLAGQWCRDALVILESESVVDSLVGRWMLD